MNSFEKTFWLPDQIYSKDFCLAADITVTTPVGRTFPERHLGCVEYFRIVSSGLGKRGMREGTSVFCRLNVIQRLPHNFDTLDGAVEIFMNTCKVKMTV